MLYGMRENNIPTILIEGMFELTSSFSNCNIFFPVSQETTGYHFWSNIAPRWFILNKGFVYKLAVYTKADSNTCSLLDNYSIVFPIILLAFLMWLISMCECNQCFYHLILLAWFLERWQGELKEESDPGLDCTVWETRQLCHWRTRVRYDHDLDLHHTHRQDPEEEKGEVRGHGLHVLWTLRPTF